MTGPWRNRRDRRERGTALVEFALVLPVFALMLFAVLQFGLVFAGGDELRNGVQAAARMAAMGYFQNEPASCQTADGYPPATRKYVCGVLGVLGRPIGTSAPVDVAVSFQPGNDGASSVVTVCASGPISALGMLPSLHIAAESELYADKSPPPDWKDFNPDHLPGCGQQTHGAHAP